MNSIPESTDVMIFDYADNGTLVDLGPMPPPPPMGPAPTLTGLVFFTVYIVVIITSNVATLIAFSVEKQLRTYNNYYIINLVLADLLVGVVLIAQIVNVYHPRNWLCKFHLGLNDALLTVSTLGIVVICGDRHRAAYDPIGHFTSRSKGKAALANALTWLISMAFWLPYTVVWDVVASRADVDNPINQACVPRYGLRLWTSMLPVALTIGLPLVLITILYGRLYWKIRQTRGTDHVNQQFTGIDSKSTETLKQSNSQRGDSSNKSASDKASKQDAPDKPGEKIPQDRESRSSTRKATRTLTFIIISFLVAWIPHTIFLVVTTLDRSILFEGNIPPVGLFAISLMRYTNSFLNPLSYAAAQPLFRKTIAKLCCCPWRY